MSDTVKPQISRDRPFFKLATELGPLAVFFFVNSRWEDIFYATGAFMAATALALAASLFVFRKIPVMPLVSGVFVLVFGGLTLYLHDDLFIKIKPTIINLTFAGLLLGGLVFGQLLIKFVFNEMIQLRDEGWRLLTIRWACFFIFLAMLNEFTWRNFSTDAWVSFKTFGIMPLTMMFTLSQLGLMRRYQIADEQESDPRA